MRFLAIPLLLIGCAHQPAPDAARCPVDSMGIRSQDPAMLRDIVVAIRTRQQEPAPRCNPREVCVDSCEEGTVCAACESLLHGVLYELASLDTDEAAKIAASLVLDARLGWDGGGALTLTHAVTRLNKRILPYLQPHVTESRLAELIVGCIERGEPCI